MLENKIIRNFASKNFLWCCCGLIFLLSIYIRSLIDIGPDSSVYMDVGKKLALGKDYFFDIFEINFPILMWLYAFQYKFSNALNISPILMAEIFVNCGALISIFYASKNLKRTKIYEDKIEFNLIIICFFLSFFLRPYGLHLAEFGTKSSFFLIFFYPYLALILIDKNKLLKKDLISKGVLMGLIACLKPHYLIFVAVIEIYLAIKQRSIHYFFEIDKLILALILSFYFVLIQRIHPNFLEYVVPMWSNYFQTYNNFNKFVTNFYSNMAFVILPYFGAFLVFSRYKMREIDKIFMIIFSASALVVVVESIFTIDQFSLFCAINLIFMARILLIILRNNFLNFSENLFFLGFFVIVPLSQADFIRLVVFGFSGVFNLWWLMLIYSFIILFYQCDLPSRKIIFSIKNIVIFLVIYVLCFAVMIKAFSGSNYWLSNFVALVFFFLFYFICEKYFFIKISQKFTQFSVFIIMASLFLYIHDYSDNFRDLTSEVGFRNEFRKIYDFKAYYYKTKAPKPNDNEIDFYNLHQLAHPIVTYFNKEMPQKMSIYGIDSSISYHRILFGIKDPQVNFVYDYMIRDIKKMLKDKNTKLIFVDNHEINEIKINKCNIGYVEYLFFDKEIKDYFLKNFKFENRLIVVDKYEIKNDLWSSFFDDEGKNEYSKYQLKGSFRKISSDIEVYVRKN
jgi:hypothetical protein